MTDTMKEEEVQNVELIVTPRTFTLEESFTFLFKSSRLQSALFEITALAGEGNEMQFINIMARNFEGSEETFYPLMKELVCGCEYTKGIESGTITALAVETIFKGHNLKLVSSGIEVLMKNMQNF